MKIVFAGYQTWGLVSLKAILNSRHKVGLVITHPAPRCKYDCHFNESVEDYSRSIGIPVIVRKKIEPSILQAIQESNSELLVSSNWRKHIPEGVLSATKLGAINVHRSLLPRYCGVAPINWAISNGEQVTGVTIHKISKEFDLGDIVCQEEISIGETETATDIFHKTTPVIGRLLPKTLDGMESGTASFLKQDPTNADFYHKRGEQELQIDWSKSNLSIFNLIRAQSDPFENAFTIFKGRKLKIKSASLCDKRYRGTSSRVSAREEGGVVVLCGENRAGQGLLLKLIQHDEEPPVEANKFFSQLGCYLGE